MIKKCLLLFLLAISQISATEQKKTIVAKSELTESQQIWLFCAGIVAIDVALLFLLPKKVCDTFCAIVDSMPYQTAIIALYILNSYEQERIKKEAQKNERTILP